MKLCHLCHHIPFENPPHLPRSYVDSLPGLPDEGDLYYVEYRDRHNPYPRTFGYHHYQSQDQLKQSAQTCNLCHLIFHEFRRIVKHASRPIVDYRFYITRREGHQEGFVVWTYGEQGIIWRVGAYGYSVKDGNDPLSAVFKGRHVTKDASSTDANDVAKHWIRNCVKNHPLCGPQVSNPPLPTRVIDLGTSSSSPIKLLETGGTMTGDYVALSYTWGDPPFPYMMTQSNLSAYKSGINFSGTKPTAIIDAIKITRLAGIRYLWVDALCIIQSTTPGVTTKDFLVEGAKMMEYYGNSYLTISADASKGVYDGIFLPRDAPTATDIHYTSDSGAKGKLTIFVLKPSKENLQAHYILFEDEPITGRGWTLQERVLSTRIIHYASDQMYYECNTHFRSEDGFSVQGRQPSIDPKTKEISLFGGQKQDSREMWDTLVQGFGGRSLTLPDQNKFLAFGGLARKFSSLYGGDQYIAGLWKKKLVESLFWVVNDADESKPKLPHWKSSWPPASANYRAPSWSWACLDVSILNPDDRIYQAVKYAKYVTHNVVLKNPADPYGQITDASLTLHVPKLLRLEVESHKHDFNWSRANDSHAKTVSMAGSTTLDYRFSGGTLQNLDIDALTLARGTPSGKDMINGPYYLCLLVTHVTGHSYRRGGTVWLDEKALGKHAPGDAPLANWVDIKLV